ncbi:MAG TPA: ATP-binding protein [Pyrinomonadaceae bacterium]|jgi:nitrogen-specific signal transduction histidine kinase
MNPTNAENIAEYARNLVIIQIPELIVYLISAAVCFLFFFIIVLFRRRDSILNNERWIKSFAIIFLSLSITHLIRAIMAYSKLFLIDFPEFILLCFYAISISSAASSYFCLRASIHLLDKTGKLDKFFKKYVNVSFKYKSRWVLLRYLTLVIFIICSFSSVLDAALSIISLILLGTAFSLVVIRYRQDFLTSVMGIFSAAAYAISFFLYEWLQLDQVPYSKVIIISISLIWKAGIFLTGFSLMLRLSSQIEPVINFINEIAKKRVNFWEKEGIVKEICLGLNVDKVDLYIKKSSIKERELILFKYEKHNDNLETKSILVDENKDYGYVINNNQIFFHNVIDHENTVKKIINWEPETRALFNQTNSNYSIICVPIIFNNAIIGCLKITFNTGKLSEADVKTLLRFTMIFSPLIQSYREIETLNDLDTELIKLQTESTKYNIQNVFDKVTAATHDKLTPLNSIVQIQSGFSKYFSTDCDSDKIESIRILTNLNCRSSLTKEKKVWQAQELNAFSNELEGKHTFGKLVVAFKEDKDDVLEPTLAADSQYRAVVANHVRDAILDYFRRYFGEITKQLSADLNGLSDLSEEDWFHFIKKSAGKAGLLWVVSDKINRSGFWGEDKHIEIVKDLEQSGQWKRKGKNISDTPYIFHLARIYDETVGFPKITNKLQYEQAKYSKKEYQKQKQFIKEIRKEIDSVTYCIIRITMSNNYKIWLGVEQLNFGIELDYYSPWKVFLDRYAEIADLVLHRIITTDKQEKFHEMAKYQGLATAAAATGTIVHQLVNLLREMEGSITVLKRAVKRDDLGSKKSHNELVLLLGDSMEQVEKIGGLVFGVVKTDTHCPCRLGDAVDFARNLLEFSLKSNNINLDVKIDADSVLDIPFNIAAFTIANLMDNAKDAIQSAGHKAGMIWIVSEEREDMFLCHIKDSGPGVLPELEKHLFREPGISSKNNGSGVGLYLSAHTLKENRGNVKITNLGPNPSTTFTIYFPKIRNGRI